MPTASAKYQGTVSYHLVYCELIQAARYRGLTTYQAIAQLMGLPLRGSHMGKEVGQILGEIAQEEMAHGRPILSALAVSVSGSPGPGFFNIALQQGKLAKSGKEAEKAFWEAERAAVYEAWARKF